VIPEHKRPALAEALVALGGTDDQISQIGDMCFTVCALPAGHDTDYLLDKMRDHDPLIRRAANMMLETLT